MTVKSEYLLADISRLMVSCARFAVFAEYSTKLLMSKRFSCSKSHRDLRRFATARGTAGATRPALWYHFWGY